MIFIAYVRDIILFDITYPIEDEYHFLVECPLYKELREQYLPKYYWKRPSVYKVIELLTNENKNLVKKQDTSYTTHFV